MKAVIFAGGVGTRLWPLSRKKSPKQFEKIVGDESTLQLAVSRLTSHFKPEDIFIATGSEYEELISQQLPAIPRKNIIGEPVRRDVGPAIAVVMKYLATHFNAQEPVFILWSDHLVKNTDKFMSIIKSSEAFITENQDKIIFIGQKPRFASENLGWIEYNDSVKKIDGIELHSFEGFQYKPNHETAQKYFSSGKHCWNLGYFVSTPAFILDLFKRFAPDVYSIASLIFDSNGESFKSLFAKHYPDMPPIHFDNVVLEKLNKSDAYVIVEDIGWSDIGAWEALKEALENHPDDNITFGNVYLEDSKDNLMYNYNKDKLIVGVDLEDILIINTSDVLLVAKKSSVPKIKKMVEGFVGTDKEHLT